MYTVCFTGHRPQKLPCGFDEGHPACYKIKRFILKASEKLIERHNAQHFISGMAIGIDMWATEIILELKQTYTNITIEAAIPCLSQPNVWRESLKKRYYELLSQCDMVNILQDEYTADCMIRRNKYMVDKSDLIIAVWNRKHGGTENTIRYAIRYAMQNKKPVYLLDTEEFKVRSIR